MKNLITLHFILLLALIAATANSCKAGRFVVYNCSQILKPLLIVLAFLTFSQGICQENELRGTYWSDSTYYVKIGTNDTIEFFSRIPSGFSFELFGVGRYEIIDSILRVKTFPPGPEIASGYKIIEELDDNDNAKLRVSNKYGPVEYCNISVVDSSSRKNITWFDADENGVSHLNLVEADLSNEAIVRFSALGMDSFSIPLSEIKGYSVEVNLKPYRVLQNDLIDFKILSKNGTFYLMGPNYPNSYDSRMKARDKLRIMLSHWPWHWNFSHFQDTVPQVFKKE